ncbi:zinc finger protein 782-like [Phlebotomus argentipes]|uniref:zinc finger protein 782-like n=1 Tax=Phlebotomus argentipes TaxID=94469 RepID=UPI0028932EF2|nr:zinc finger protein 782-like [Phlebotomus argentipes]
MEEDKVEMFHYHLDYYLETEDQFLQSDIVIEESKIQEVIVPVIKRDFLKVNPEMGRFEVKEPKLEFKCEICESSFNTKRGLQVHNYSHSKKGHRQHHPKKVRKEHFCEKCNKFYKSSMGIWYHKRTVHVNKPVILSCIYCGNTYEKYTGMNSHMKTRHRGLPRKKGAIPECSLCKMVCKSIEDLKEHVEVKHSLEDRFKCGVCGWKTSYKYMLRNHMKMRHGYTEGRIRDHMKAKKDMSEHDRHLECEICNQTFKTKRTLKNHMETHFIPAKENYLKCLYCPKSFYRLMNLREHARYYHRGLSARPTGPPFKCTCCAEEYERLDDLVKHVVIHRRL